MSWRTKPNSVSEAEGKAISISLKPMAQSVLNMRIFFSAFIGSKSAWLPSRRSVLIQIGAWVMVRPGHWRSTRLTGGKGTYLACDGCMALLRGKSFSMTKYYGKAHGRCLRIRLCFY